MDEGPPGEHFLLFLIFFSFFIEYGTETRMMIPSLEPRRLNATNFLSFFF